MSSFIHVVISQNELKLLGRVEKRIALNMQFDCICLSEVWNYDLDFYKNLFPSYRGYFEKVIDSNVGGVEIYIENELKISNFNIELSKNVRVENLWLR